MWNYLATINNKYEAFIIAVLLCVLVAGSVVIMKKIWKAKKLKFWGLEIDNTVGKKK